MDYFDGTEDELKESGLDRYGKTYQVRSFKSGSTQFRYTMGIIKILILGFVAAVLIGAGFSLLMWLITGDTLLMLVLLISFTIGTIGIFGILFLILFITMYLSASNLIHHTQTGITGDGIEFRFKRDGMIPQQITFIPFRYLVNVHPVTDEEWKRDLGMGNFFRSLIDFPKENPGLRVLRGSGRSNVYVLQMSREMPLKSIRMKGMPGHKYGPVLESQMLQGTDRYVQIIDGRSDKIFFSFPSEKYNEFIQILDQTMKRSKENMY